MSWKPHGAQGRAVEGGAGFACPKGRFQKPGSRRFATLSSYKLPGSACSFHPRHSPDHYSINPQGLLQVPPPQPRQPLVRMLAAASLLQRQLLGEGWARCLWTGPRTVLRCWPLAEHRSTVVFLHGLGDQGDALEPLAEALQPQLRHTKFILPTAPVVSGGARAAPCALG